MSSRLLLGAAAAGLVIAGGIIWLGVLPGSAVTGGILLRSGLVLGSLWLALPSLARLSWLAVVGAAAMLVAVLLRPALLWALPVLLIVVGIGRSRRRPTTD